MKKVQFQKIILLAVLLLFPIVFRFATFYIGHITLAGITAIAASGLDVILGYSGQITLAQAAFMGIGAYVSTVLCLKFGFGFVISVIIAIIVCGVLGVVVGFIALRIHGLFLAIVTLALGECFLYIIKTLELTGGEFGISNIPPIAIFGFKLQNEVTQYYLVLFFLLGILYFKKNLTESFTGKCIRAVRDSEIAAMSVGIDPTRYKVLAFVFGSVVAGIAGILYARVVGYIHPFVFGIGYSIELLAIDILGGIATLIGPVIGAIFWTVLHLLTRSMEVFSSVIFGLILILVILFYPAGVTGFIKEVYSKVKFRLNRKQTSPN